MQAEDKNAPMHTSTPAVTARKKKNFGKLNMESPIKESTDAAQAMPVKRDKVDKDLVLEAVRIVGIDKKGISLQAITKYIGEVRGEKSPDVTSIRVKNQIKKIILTLVEQEMLIRPKSSSEARGVTGLFQVSKHARFPVLKCKPVTIERGLSVIKKSNERAKLAEANAKTDTLKKGANKEKLAAEKVTKKPTKKQVPEQTEEKPAKPAKKLAKSKAKVDPVTKSVYSDFEDEDGAENQEHEKNTEKVVFSNSEDEAEENKAPETNVKVRGRKKNEQKTKETSNAKQGTSKIKGKNAKQPEAQKPTAKVTKRAKNQDSKPASNLKRKDLSDTEIDVPASFPKPLKSYSSDTELEVSRRMENKRAGRVKKHDSNIETTAMKENSAAQNQTKLRKKR